MTLQSQVYSIVRPKRAVSPFQRKFLNLLLLVDVWSGTIFQGNSASHHPSSLFPITYRNKYFAGQVFQSLHLDDWLLCLSACTNAKECVSYNFYPKLGTCELNSEGITECEEENRLVFTQGWIFQQIKDTSFWLPWQPWGPCSVTCGNGLKRRMRDCGSLNTDKCNGPEEEVKNCRPGDCIDISQFCVGKENGNYPDVTNCRRFIQCSGEHTYFTNCPSGLVYDSIKDQCVYSSNSNNC